MSDRITSTELARRFGDILAEVKHGGRTITVTKNGEPIAELGPAEGARRCTLRDFAEAWHDSREDDSFATDLEAVNAADKLMANPWD